jgi:fused signal recognition particle receptor
MFGKLKDKLKGALNVFSKKAEEEAEEIPKEKIEEVIAKAEKKAVIEESKKEVVEEKKKEPKVEKKVEAPKSEIQTEEKEEIIITENPKEEKLKEEHLSKKEVEKDTTEEKLEHLDEQIKEEKIPEPELEKEEVVEKQRTAEDLIKETKEQFADDHLTFKEKKEKKEAEKGPSAEELLEEVKTEEPAKKKGLFGLFKKKEKVIEEQSNEVASSSAKPAEQETKEEDKSEPVEESETKEEVEEQKTEEAAEEPKGFFGKVKQSLTTKTITADKFEDLFWELEITLLENNVSVEVIEKIKEDLKEELVDKPLPRDVLKKIEETLARTMNEILTFDQIDVLKKADNKKPLVVAFFGINGCGKTTSIAKLANYLKENGKSVVLAACDTFRAAAIQQLEEHANKIGVKMIKHDYGSDAAAVAYDAVKHAEKNEIDVVLIDTAGRLHSNTNLMAELEKIIRVTTPDLKIFVGESITGNDCIEQAKKFNELVEMDGAILTKADIDEKGGAPLSIAYTIKKPILFLGMGQEYKDFEVFNKKVILDRLGF